MAPAGDSRGRQGKKDEALRRKLEAGIAKRRNPVGLQKASKKKHKGSILSLKPDAPVTMESSTLVYEAAQFMCARKASCILVLDKDGAVEGIFTAKDLAFKVVGAGRDAHALRVADIMTPQPMCATISTSAIDALDLMVKRGFRHLPVLDDEGEIAGVLDITKCFYEAMQKLDRAYESSRKLFDALEGVQSEFGANHPSQLVSYAAALRQHTTGPTLDSVLDPSKQPVVLDVRTNVTEATQAMQAARTTAALVTDNDAITGIFTSKDVVNRVVAAGLNPKKVSIVRVMTPQPDYAPIDTPIQAALRKMHEGHYLNLPVMDHDQSVVGIVDVLRLTYATLEQIKSMGNPDKSDEGPAWNKFWMSLDDDTDSVHSGSHAASTQVTSPNAEEVNIFKSPKEELAPEDSLSRTGFREEVQTPTPWHGQVYFKFKAPSGRTHKIPIKSEDNLESIRAAISTKLGPSDLDKVGGNDGYALSYFDDEGDLVAITSDHDVEDVVEHAKLNRVAKVDVLVHHLEEQPQGRNDSREPLGGIKPEFLIGAIGVIAIAAMVIFRPKN